MKKRNILLIALTLSVLAIAPKLVLAATSSQLRICEYAGVLRTLKIFGIVLIIINPWYNYYDRKEYNLKTKSKFILAKMLKKGRLPLTPS